MRNISKQSPNKLDDSYRILVDFPSFASLLADDSYRTRLSQFCSPHHRHPPPLSLASPGLCTSCEPPAAGSSARTNAACAAAAGTDLAREAPVGAAATGAAATGAAAAGLAAAGAAPTDLAASAGAAPTDVAAAAGAAADGAAAGQFALPSRAISSLRFCRRSAIAANFFRSVAVVFTPWNRTRFGGVGTGEGAGPGSSGKSHRPVDRSTDLDCGTGGHTTIGAFLSLRSFCQPEARGRGWLSHVSLFELSAAVRTFASVVCTGPHRSRGAASLFPALVGADSSRPADVARRSRSTNMVCQFGRRSSAACCDEGAELGALP